MNLSPETPKNNPMRIMGANNDFRISTRDIATECGKQHAHIIRDFEKMCGDIGVDASKFGSIYLDAYNREKKEYLLPRDLFMTQVSGYRADIRFKLVKLVERLQEEASEQSSLPDFSDPAAAARAWADQVEQSRALQIENRAKDAEINAMQPMVREYEAYLSEEGVCRIMDFCNKHGVKKNHPGYVLREKGMLHQKKVLATQIGLKSGILKNVLEKTNFEYIDSKGQSVEAQQAMIVRQREVSLLKMIVDAYGQTAFRNRVAFDRAKGLTGGAK